MKHVEEMNVAVILLDPHTMPNHVKALRTVPDVLIVDVPSSIGDLPGATSYGAIFDNFVQALQKCAKERGGKS